MLWAVTPLKCGAQAEVEVEALGMAVQVTQTMMHGARERRALARDMLEFAAELRG